MRVLHVNSTSHLGGAARAMQRLSQALVEKGHQTQFLVGRSQAAGDPRVHLIWDEVARFRTPLDSLRSRFGNTLEKYLGINSWANRPNLRVAESPLVDWADIIDLRNLFGGYFNLWSLPSLTARKPVVWRLPDLWAVTGHCAYPYDCQRWITGCHACPLLKREGRKRVEPGPTVWDGTRRVWKAKKALYQSSRLHIVVTTNWMRDQVAQSILADALSINVISNGVNLSQFRPADKRAARRALDLPPDEVYLLWAAGGKGNYRKGYHLALKALEILQSQGSQLPTLITMGGKEGWTGDEGLSRLRHFGYVADADLQARIYAAADGFLCPTLADGQPQTALESMACGTPVIAFDLGPMPEEVQDGVTGVLVPQTTPEALAAGIKRFLDLLPQGPRLQENCRRQAEEKYDLAKQTGRYVDLYEQLAR